MYLMGHAMKPKRIRLWPVSEKPEFKRLALGTSPWILNSGLLPPPPSSFLPYSNPTLLLGLLPLHIDIIAETSSRTVYISTTGPCGYTASTNSRGCQPETGPPGPPRAMPRCQREQSNKRCTVPTASLILNRSFHGCERRALQRQ